MADRVVRVMVEMGIMETASEGNTQYSGPEKPEDGNHPRFSAKTSISIRPSQKEGMDAPTSERNVAI